MQFNLEQTENTLQKLLNSKIKLELNGYEALIISAVFLARKEDTDSKLLELFNDWEISEEQAKEAINGASAQSAVIHSEFVSVECAVMKDVLGVSQ